MPLTVIPLPFGLRDVRITPYVTATGALDTANKVDLPYARVFTFKETEDFEELKGDDTSVASHGAGPVVEWELEAGGISLEAYKLIAGGAITTSGTTPSQIKTFTKLNSDSRPYFQVEGQAISDSGGDMHCTVFRCKADGDLEGSFENGQFMVTKCKGKGYGDPVLGNKLYTFVQNETTTAIA